MSFRAEVLIARLLAICSKLSTNKNAIIPIYTQPLKGGIMINLRAPKIASMVFAIVMALAFAMPASAAAEQLEVNVESHTNANGLETLSGLAIDGVDAPNPGTPLDDKALVSSNERAEWEIPVLWVADNLELSTEAQEGRSYLPALVFYLPQGYASAENEFTVTLSDSLTELFGGSEVVSVYDARTGITYIVPASLRDFFTSAQRDAVGEQSDWGQTTSESSEAPSASDNRSLIDIYCAQTARDAFTDEDLEFILDLILNKLEPQAVELLLDSFPAFRAAADQGQIGREIGLYVYYEAGDKDGIAEHEVAPSGALAYVASSPVVDGDSVKFCYMIGVDLSSLVLVDDDDSPVRSSTTGKFVLVREGENMITLENTIVHEMFHAVMDDYNRTGMLGATDIRNAITDEKGNYPTQELKDLHEAISFPRWFVEGSASSVENVYDFRNSMFKMLRAEQGSDTKFTDYYNADGLLYNYLNATSDKKSLYFDLEFSDGYDENGNVVDTDQSRYVSGYLATLYLSELAAKKTMGSAIKETEDTVAISSERLRAGLNSILERMHNGETMDQVVSDISPVDANGKKLYSDTNDFEAKFIKGAGAKTATSVNYSGDNASIEFVTTFLNYLVAIENTMGQDKKPAGSILMDFGTELDSPLYGTKDSHSDFFQIVESNELVESTVPNEVALAGGGKSESGTAGNSGDAAKLAAKAASNDCEVATAEASVEQAGNVTSDAQTMDAASDTQAKSENPEVQVEEANYDEQPTEESSDAQKGNTDASAAEEPSALAA